MTTWNRSSNYLCTWNCLLSARIRYNRVTMVTWLYIEKRLYILKKLKGG